MFISDTVETQTEIINGLSRSLPREQWITGDEKTGYICCDNLVHELLHIQEQDQAIKWLLDTIHDNGIRQKTA